MWNKRQSIDYEKGSGVVNIKDKISPGNLFHLLKLLNLRCKKLENLMFTRLQPTKK